MRKVIITMKSNLYNETIDLMRMLAECRQENRTDDSTNPMVNKAESALNELLTGCVKRLEQCNK